jgi:EAL domain-containing protein (putative c-di-GMP-specific phosphodiesterase class I)
MIENRIRTLPTLTIVIVLSSALAWAQSPAGTAFTFQGVFKQSGTPADGVFDLRFTLFDAATGTGQIGDPVTVEDVAVTSGVFAVELDFGAGAFAGDARWVEIGVRDGGSTGALSALSPRRQLTPTPYAVDAATLGGEPQTFYRDASNLNAGTLDPDRFSAYIDLAAEGYLDNNAGSDLLTRHQANQRFVNEGQDNSISSSMITDGTITQADLFTNTAVSGQVLATDGVDFLWRDSAAGLHGLQEFTTDGSWTAPSGVTSVLVEAWGGGGGGGGGADWPEGTNGGAGGGGGGAGAYVRSVVSVAAGTTYTIDVGAGGSGGLGGTEASPGHDGTSGTATRIRSGSTVLLSAPGGAFGEGGTASQNPGTGGAAGSAGSGDITRDGGDGKDGKSGSHTMTLAIPGDGGALPYDTLALPTLHFTARQLPLLTSFLCSPASPARQYCKIILQLMRKGALMEPEVAAPDDDQPPRVLVVDDEPDVREAFAELLEDSGFAVSTASTAAEALDHVESSGWQTIVTDIVMPGMDGLQLLRKIREHDLEVPVIVVTGQPTVDFASRALEYGAFRFITKPVSAAELEGVVSAAVRQYRMAQLRLKAASLAGYDVMRATDIAGLEASLESALKSLHMLFQPIVRAADRTVFGYEALMRSEEPALPHPGAVLDAAQQLERLHDVGRRVRENVATPLTELVDGLSLFVNLHPRDLLDPQLIDPDQPLCRQASRVILEITERAQLGRIPDMPQRIAALRQVGFRIAVDDLGAGYSGLASFAQLEPEVVKLDMSLIRDIDTTVTKQRVVRSMVEICRDLGIQVVAEGIETANERDAVIDLGCDLLQGYHFGRPSPPFITPSW